MGEAPAAVDGLVGGDGFVGGDAAMGGVPLVLSDSEDGAISDEEVEEWMPPKEPPRGFRHHIRQVEGAILWMRLQARAAPAGAS